MRPAEPARLARSIAAIAATYVAFLLCAQYGFLAQVKAALGDRPDTVRDVLAAMAVAGIAAGALAALAGRRLGAAAAVRIGLVATSIATATSVMAARPATLALAAAALGGALGWLTVSLAGGLGELVPRGWAGRAAGWGTAIAYAISNLPPLFDSSSARRAFAGAVACLVAALWAPTAAPAIAERTAPGWNGRVRLALLLAFFGLVAVDAAFFAHLQRVPELLGLTWGSPSLSLRQGVAHFVAAILAGVWLDRGGLKALLPLVAVGFAIALPALAELDPATAGLAAVAYAFGISAYSAALVAAPALAGGGRRSALSFAALLYGVAGWVGSGFGVGAAEHGALGVAALAGLGVFALAGLVLLAGRFRVRQLVPPAATVAVAIALALAIDARAGESVAAPAGADGAIARGRAVYLAEGCQHCHSQYVRPATRDELWWGPARALDRGESPPTPGNRRIGPDLANAGLRRSATWHELHLRDPRAVSRGSRMPSYAHLFDDGGERGADLVAYLVSLGRGATRQRAAQIAAAPAPAAAGSPARGAALFARHCAACHGAAGRGDGAVASAFARPTMDLARGAFARVVGTGDEPLPRALARTIRFGLEPGTMAGHEWLSDQEIADLVAFVLELSGSRSAS